jgi:hypothetical protein
MAEHDGRIAEEDQRARCAHEKCAPGGFRGKVGPPWPGGQGGSRESRPPPF